MPNVMNYRLSDEFHWRQDAACAKPGAPYMFPPENDVVAVPDAKAWCRKCPVAGDCLREALDRREPYGIWGGTTPAEREGILRRRDRSKKRDK